MFHTFYRYLHGAATKKYVRSIDNISESDALKMQKILVDKFGTELGMKKYMRTVADNVGDRFENEVIGSAIDILKILGVTTKDKTSGNIGKIPNTIVIDDVLYKKAERGELSGLLESFKNVKNETEALGLLLGIKIKQFL